MRILLTNDDGYTSEGLMLLCEKLAQQHEVYVVAPDGQRSAFSHYTSFHRQIRFFPLDSYCNAKCAYISSGTPADCVKFAYSQLNVQFDLLIAGPNNGSNFGCDIPYSGTVGAAEEGVICGIKSIAISRLGHKGGFGALVEFLCNNLTQLTSYNFVDTLININVPDLPSDQIKGVRVTKQGGRFFNDFYEKAEIDHHWVLLGDRFKVDPDLDCDVSLAEKGYITITPLSIYQTDMAALKTLKELEK